MAITRIDQGPRLSEAVVHGDTIYLAGQIGEPDQDITEQTKTALAEIDLLLEKTGSDRDHLLSATIWLADMADFEAMNAVWDEWISGHPAPTRATGESRLASPDYKVEIIIIAAKA